MREKAGMIEKEEKRIQVTYADLRHRPSGLLEQNGHYLKSMTLRRRDSGSKSKIESRIGRVHRDEEVINSRREKAKEKKRRTNKGCVWSTEVAKVNSV